MGFTEFSGSKWEKECVDAMEKVLKEKQLNIDMWKRLKPKLKGLEKKDVEALVAAKKKEVDAIKKAWGSVKEPEKEYVALIDKELAEEMKAIKQMQQALDKKKETLEAEFKQQEDACKMVYKGMGGLRTVFSTLHRTADEVLKLLEKHLETMN